MSKNRYYYYDHETCSFVELRPGRKKLYAQASVIVLLALVVSGIVLWGFDRTTQTPQELALQAENEVLQSQLDQVKGRLDVFSTQLSSLTERDQALYRTLLEAEPISEDVRRVGAGGTNPYADYERFSPNTSTLLSTTAEKLDQIERQIALQNTSYRELASLADEHRERLNQMPGILPANGPVVSGYGLRRHPILKVRKMHHGIDVLVPRGTPVVAAGEGVVKKAAFSATFGRHVVIEHPQAGYVTLYAHLSEIDDAIRPGRRVERAQQIGLSGSTGRSTGPHLHYEVHDLEGRTVNPVFFFAPTMTPERYEQLLKEASEATISLD